MKKPVILMILDGWGIAPPSDGNAVSQADTPNFKKLIAAYPAMTLYASGAEVGLSPGEMGNSEVGHLNIGAGRVYYQTLPRINKSINDGSFFKTPAFLKAVGYLSKSKGKLHLIGIIGVGGVHGHSEHLFNLLKFAKEQKIKDVFIHAFLDGRDTIFNSGLGFVSRLEEKIEELKVGKIATISGRFYAMDRDNRWDRTEKAYQAMVFGQGNRATDAKIAIEDSYSKKIYDEEFAPVVLEESGRPIAQIQDGDAVIFFNFRADRARQLTQAFVAPDFNKFPCQKFKKLFFATMVEYEKDLPVEIAFPPDLIVDCLAKVVSDAGLKQFHIAETEKYAHITFFINGQKEEPFVGEERAIIPSPRVSSYDQKSQMSAPEITARVLKEIENDKYDLILMNLANPDMVGHTANKEATIKAIEAVDKCVGEIAKIVLEHNGALFITGDHGNAEELINLQTGEIDKEHSTNPVPFILVGRQWEGQTMGLPEGIGADLSLAPPVGVLGDVAPTILKVLGIPQPKEMTGRALI